MYHDTKNPAPRKLAEKKFESRTPSGPFRGSVEPRYPLQFTAVIRCNSISYESDTVILCLLLRKIYAKIQNFELLKNFNKPGRPFSKILKMSWLVVILRNFKISRRIFKKF